MKIKDRLWLLTNRRPPRPWESYLNTILYPIIWGAWVGALISLFAHEGGLSGLLDLRGAEIALTVTALIFTLALLVWFAVWTIQEHKALGIYQVIANKDRDNWHAKRDKLTITNQSKSEEAQK